MASLAVNLAVLASLGPIVLFFSLTTKSYPFIQLLNVAMFTVAGVLGLLVLAADAASADNSRPELFPAAKGETSKSEQIICTR